MGKKKRRGEPPDPEGGEQNRDYRNGDDRGVDDEAAKKAKG